MLQAELGRSNRDVLWLERVDRARHSGLHVAEGTGAGACVAEDHHGRVLLGPALADIRTSGFLAHRRKTEIAHQLARRMVAWAGRRLDADPVWLALTKYRCGIVHAGPDSDWARRLPPLPRNG